MVFTPITSSTYSPGLSASYQPTPPGVVGWTNPSAAAWSPAAVSTPPPPTQVLSPAPSQQSKPLSVVSFSLPEDRHVFSPAVSGRHRRLSVMDYLLRPIETYRLRTQLKGDPQSNEPLSDRISMYLTLRDSLSVQGVARLRHLLASGRLTRFQNSQDGRNTLAHLYNIMTTPRAKDKYGQSLDPVIIVEDFLRLSDNIQSITQPFQQLTNLNAAKLLDFYNNDPKSPYFNRKLTRSDVEVAHSATCVSASMMASMIGEHDDLKHRPQVDYLAEFTRQLEGLTSEHRQFTKKVNRQVLCPSDPAKAEEVVQSYGLKAKPLNNQEFLIVVDLPEDAVIRGINAQQNYRKGSQGVTESVVQSAYTALVDPNYVPGLDHRVTNGKIEDIPGIEADRKQLLESITVGKPIVSIQYQFTAVDRPDGAPYLVGYTRSFPDTLNDILTSLQLGKKPIVGIVWTDENGPTQGRIPGGHEFLIVDAEQRKGEWFFKIFDSDDGDPNAVWRSAREIIPRIHHVGLPLSLAQQVQKQMDMLGDNQYLVPDTRDTAQFDLIKTLPVERHTPFLQAYERLLAAEDQPNQPAPTPATVQQAVAQTPPSFPMAYGQPTGFGPTGYSVGGQAVAWPGYQVATTPIQWPAQQMVQGYGQQYGTPMANYSYQSQQPQAYYTQYQTAA